MKASASVIEESISWISLATSVSMEPRGAQGGDGLGISGFLFLVGGRATGQVEVMYRRMRMLIRKPMPIMVVINDEPP